MSSAAAIAEIKQSLSIESFSYSWVVNVKLSLENQEDDFSLSFSRRFSLDEPNSFIEMDPKLPPSRRFFIVPQQDLSTFHFPTLESSSFEEVHADELIYNGYLTPLVVKKIEKIDSLPISSSCLDGKQELPDLRKFGSASLRRCRILSKNVFLKYLDFLNLLCKKIRMLHNKNNSHCSSAKECPSEKRVVEYSMEDNCYWRSSCDSDSSIYEAVLHCKRTIDAGKQGNIK